MMVLGLTLATHGPLKAALIFESATGDFDSAGVVGGTNVDANQ
jgi:hypothetical protein